MEDVEALLGHDPSPGWLGPLRLDDDGQPVPVWSLVDGRPVVDGDLEPGTAREAWARAAEWAQAELDDAERMLRVMDAARTKRLLTAYRTSMTDLATRFGSAQGQRGGQGARLFFAQTAIALGMRPGQVAHRVDSGETLEQRLPATWAEYLAGTASWQAVDLAVGIGEGLDPDRWAAYDAATAPAVASTPPARLQARLRGIRERVQRDSASDRAERTAQRRRVTVEPGHDGEGHLTISGPIVDVAAMGGAIRRAAVAAHGAHDETRTLAQLQYDIARDLVLHGIRVAADAGSDVAVPARVGVVPTVVVTVPVLALLGRSDEHALLEGFGPISPATARRLAADAPSFQRLLTDPITGVRRDLDRRSYIPPADLRRWVKVRDEVCRFPGCARPAAGCDVDHADEWQHGGVTAAANLVSLCRSDHLGKSTGMTRERLQPDGSVEWETPWGRILADPPPDPLDPAPTGLLGDATECEMDDCPF